jgi:hypothetical protein
MKIGIYNECSRGDTQFDGSERYALAITEALAPHHQVEFIHHKPHLNAEHLAKFSGRCPRWCLVSLRCDRTTPGAHSEPAATLSQ